MAFDHRAVGKDILRLMRRNESLLEPQDITHVVHYTAVGEEEMALESLCLDLMDHPQTLLADVEEMARLCKIVGLDQESVYDPDFWANLTDALEERRKRGSGGGLGSKAIKRSIQRLTGQSQAALSTKEYQLISEDCGGGHESRALERLCLGLMPWPETSLARLEELAQLCRFVRLDRESTLDPDFWAHFSEVLEERRRHAR